MFFAVIKDPNLNTNVGQGIWAYDPEGGVQLLARTGELFEVAPGDWRTISGGLALGSGSILADGDVRGLTDAGQFVFSASFDDDSEGGEDCCSGAGNVDTSGIGFLLPVARFDAPTKESSVTPNVPTVFGVGQQHLT